MLRSIWNTIYYSLFFTVVAVASLLLLSLFPFDNWYQVKVVLSGSMEPVIQVGSIVVIKPQTSYGVGDVITFGADNRQQIPVTHRIVGEDRGQFITQGDANSNVDSGLVNVREIIGSVTFTVPFVGYVLEFMKTPAGFWTLVVVPASLIVLLELVSIGKQLLAHRRQNTASS